MKLSTSPTPSRLRPQGISLFELLLSVALIGVLLSLAVPLLGAQEEAMQEVRAKRNAQELVGEFQVARAAGVDFLVANDLPATLQRLCQGQQAVEGVFAGRHFGVANLNAVDQKEAAAHLQLVQGDLRLR